MKTKFISIAAIILLSATFAFSQTIDKPATSFGILGGVNFQNFNGKDNSGDKIENDMIIGFHAGVNIMIPLVPEFYFQPGLLFTTKGSKHVYDLATETVSISYIELPLNLVYRGLLGNGHVLIGFGPYVAYGIMGKVKLESDLGDLTSDIEFKNELADGDDYLTPFFKALDAGGNVFFGYEMAGGLFMQMNAQLGMLKINPDDKRLLPVYGEKLSVKNTGFGLSLGYRF